MQRSISEHIHSSSSPGLGVFLDPDYVPDGCGGGALERSRSRSCSVQAALRPRLDANHHSVSAPDLNKVN